MQMREVVERAARRSGAAADEADAVIEALLHELSDAIAAGQVVSLGDFGTFAGQTFRPGPALAQAPAAPPSGLEGYDEGTAPRDS